MSAIALRVVPEIYFFLDSFLWGKKRGVGLGMNIDIERKLLNHVIWIFRRVNHEPGSCPPNVKVLCK